MPRCPVCDEPIEFGCMWDDGTLVHEHCFEEYMDKEYGNWRQVSDDGNGGYYEAWDGTEWYGTGIFYTELEESELKEMED